MIVQRRPGNSQDQRDAAAGQHRAGRPHERPAPVEGHCHFEDRACQDRREDLRNTDLEAQPHLPQHVDGDDDRSDVQPGVARVRQDHGVCGSSERERPVGHIVSHCGLVGLRHSTTRTPRNAAASSGTRCGSILAVPDVPTPAPEDEHHRARRSRPRRLLVTVLRGCRGRRRARRSCCRACEPVNRQAARALTSRRISSTTRLRRASTTPMPESRTSSSGVAWRRSTATTTGAMSCSSPAAASPLRSISTRARSADRCGSPGRSRRSPT